MCESLPTRRWRTQPGHCGQACELTGGQLFTLGEMVADIGGALGQPPTYIDTPPIAAGLALVPITELHGGEEEVLRGQADSSNGPGRRLRAMGAG